MKPPNEVLLPMMLMLSLIFVGTQKALAQTETVLSSFVGGTSDGQIPHGRLVMDSSGNLYGTTFSGGTYNKGTVSRLSPGTPWTKKVLHNFASVGDGAYPWGGLTLVEGNLYGTTTRGGTSDHGTLFELTPGISWTLTGLYSFTGGVDG